MFLQFQYRYLIAAHHKIVKSKACFEENLILKLDLLKFQQYPGSLLF